MDFGTKSSASAIVTVNPKLPTSDN
jgi:hypothetical protein